MISKQIHSFHIPVMGLGYTIDTPVKVGRFGISSVVSIIEDQLVESMREIHCQKANVEYIPVTDKEPGHRAKRVKLYLNLINSIVQKQVAALREEPFEDGRDIVKYFELLDDSNPLKKLFAEMREEPNERARFMIQDFLRSQITAGAIDVNIMTKLDRNSYDSEGNINAEERSDALAALQGFAESELSSSIVFSAGLNPRLYAYCATFPDFFPDENGDIRKSIILKVSDYRSAMIQGKFLAKRGLWISEFRIESGLNCGGHAFAADGLLIGPVLEEFRLKKDELCEELITMCNAALISLNKNILPAYTKQRITVQGGIGTSDEDKFLMEKYELDGTGWGSPFLLVPEATNVDEPTLKLLECARKEDYYLSHSSPLGIPLNNFRKSSSQRQREDRIAKNRPGSPCLKKYLAFDTEFTKEPICVASREYQNLKIRQLCETISDESKLMEKTKLIEEKECLCEGLGAAALIVNNAIDKLRLKAVAICPGPNLAYFSGRFSLQEMVNHIYGRKNILNKEERPHMFVNELKMNVDFLQQEMSKMEEKPDSKYEKYIREFGSNLLSGIEYYKNLMRSMSSESDSIRANMSKAFDNMSERISGMLLQVS